MFQIWHTKLNCISENEISNKIHEAAIQLHKKLGPGLLKSVYLECLCYLLKREGLNIEKQKPLPVIFEEVKLEGIKRVANKMEDSILE